MKRSEVVDRLTEFFIEHKDMVGYGWSDRELVDNLLGLAEQLGMLPPYSQKMFNPDKGMNGRIWEEEK